MYISAEWLGPLEDALIKAERKHSGSISMLSDIFNDPHELVRCYIEPRCRYQDHFDNAGKVACFAFDAVNLFMGEGIDESIQGGNQLLILGNSGSGKTSLLSILRLAQVLNYRDRNLRCELLRLGLDTLDKIASISNPVETVLLLDGLDEDREAQSSARQRLLDLLEASQGFKRGFLACENRYFFQNSSDQSSGDKGGRVGDFDCPTVVLLDFDVDQVDQYLDTRFPKQWRQKLLKGGAHEAAAKQVMNLGVLKHRPLMLSLIGYLFENDGPLKDEYSLMEAVSVQWLIQENERAQNGGASNLTMESWFEFAKLLATKMTEIGQYSVSEHRVLEWLPAGADSAHLNGVSFEAYSLLQKHDFGAGERSYRFSHRSIQKFFAAQGVLDSNDEYEEVDFEKCRLEGVKLSKAEEREESSEKPVPGKPVSFEIEDGLFLDMLWVEPGSFNIGNRDSPVVIEIPQGFWLSKCVVTQRMYYAIMEMNPSAFQSEDKELPVEQVSWSDAQYFCEELTRLMPEGLGEPLEFRLPKESEWVHACRDGNDTNYSYGDNERVFGQHGWYSGNSDGRTHKPGGKRPNPWGFHDMHGNVWEWCYDRDDNFAHRLIRFCFSEMAGSLSRFAGTLLVCIVFVDCCSLWAEKSFLGVPREDIEEVMDLGYNLDPRTPGLIGQIIEDYPESPMGLCLKAARLFRLDDYAEGSDEEVSERFEVASDLAIEAAKDYYNRYPSDPETRYALAMCELNLARYYIDHRRWLSGFFKATSGLGHLKAILKEHPDFHDAKMPLGVANCFLDKTPAYLKPLAALLRFSGNIELGLQQLHESETKGFLTRYESLYYQVSVQWVLLDDKEAAAEILDRFIERFPRNVDAVAMRAHLDRKRERNAEAFAGYQYILSLPEISYLGEMRDWVILHSGNLAIQLEKPEIALEKGIELLETVEESRRELRAWAQMLYANALLHSGRREEAREQFAKVRRRDNSDAFKATASILEEMDEDEE